MMTAPVSPFRRLQDASAAVAAAGYEGAAWAEYLAAESAARGYELTPRERLEHSMESVMRDYEALVKAEAEGGDVDSALRLLARMASYLSDDAGALRDEGVKR